MTYTIIKQQAYISPYIQENHYNTHLLHASMTRFRKIKSVELDIEDLTPT